MFKSAYTEHKALELYCKWVWNPKFREIGKQLASKIHSKFKGAKIVVFAPGVAPGSFSLPIMFGLAEELRGNELVLIGVDKSDIGLCFVRKLLEEQAYLSDLLAMNTGKEETIQKIFEGIDENSQFPKGRHTINKRSYLPFTVHLYKADLDGTSTLYKDDDNAGLTWQEIIKNEMTPEAFHLILAPFVFHHLADWRKGVINSLSCLKTGGFFLFMEARGDAAVLENDLIETEAASGEAEEKGRPFVRFWREFWEERRQLGQDEWKEITAVDHSTLKYFILDFKEYFKEHRHSNGCFREIRYTKCWKLRDMINCVAVGMFDTFRRMEAVYEKRSQIARKLEKKFESLEKEFDNDPTKLRWDVHLIEKVKSVEPNKKQHYGTLGSFKNMLDFYSYDPSIYKTKICDMLSYFIRQLIGHDEVRVHFKLWSILLNDWIQSSTAIQSSAYTLDCETLDVPDDLRPKFPDKSAENRLFSLQLESHQIDADQQRSIQTLLKSFTENEAFLLRKRLCESESQLAKYIPSPLSHAYINESLRQLAKAFHMLHALPSNHIAGALQFTGKLGENVLTYMEYFCNPEEYNIKGKEDEFLSFFSGLADYISYLNEHSDFSNTDFLFNKLLGKVHNIIFFTYTRRNTTEQLSGCISDRRIETGMIEINFDLPEQKSGIKPLVNIPHYFRPPVCVDAAFAEQAGRDSKETEGLELDRKNLSHGAVAEEVRRERENLEGVLSSFMQIPTWKIVVCIPAITKIKGKYEGFGVLFLFLKTPISLLWLKALYRMVNAFYASLNTWVWAEKTVLNYSALIGNAISHNLKKYLWMLEQKRDDKDLWPYLMNYIKNQAEWLHYASIGKEITRSFQIHKQNVQNLSLNYSGKINTAFTTYFLEKIIETAAGIKALKDYREDYEKASHNLPLLKDLTKHLNVSSDEMGTFIKDTLSIRFNPDEIERLIILKGEDMSKLKGFLDSVSGELLMNALRCGFSEKSVVGDRVVINIKGEGDNVVFEVKNTPGDCSSPSEDTSYKTYDSLFEETSDTRGILDLACRDEFDKIGGLVALAVTMQAVSGDIKLSRSDGFYITTVSFFDFMKKERENDR